MGEALMFSVQRMAHMGGAVLALLVSITAPPMLQSQTARVSLYRGIAEYDLSGVDETTITALRSSVSISRFFAVEASVGYAEVKQELRFTKLYMPEIMAQLHWPLGRFAPYVSAGTGFSVDTPKDAQLETEREATLSAGIGFHIDLPFQLSLGVDGRLRSFGKPFTASGAEATVGIGYRF